MQRVTRTNFVIAAVVIVGLWLLPVGDNGAQDKAKKPKPEYIQAQAMGASTQLGRTFSVTLIIEEYSTADDQKVLVDAFDQKKNEGLVIALSKMMSHGEAGSPA